MGSGYSQRSVKVNFSNVVNVHVAITKDNTKLLLQPKVLIFVQTVVRRYAKTILL